MDLREIEWDVLDWIHLAQDKNRWLARTHEWTLWFHKRRGISWLAEWLSASEEGLWLIELLLLFLLLLLLTICLRLKVFVSRLSLSLSLSVVSHSCILGRFMFAAMLAHIPVGLTGHAHLFTLTLSLPYIIPLGTTCAPRSVPFGTYEPILSSYEANHYKGLPL